MRYQTLGDKAGFISERIRANTAMTAGQPAILALNGTEDGLLVVLPSAAANAAAAAQWFYGIVVDSLNAKELGEVIRHGIHPKAQLRVRTRAASTDTWASVASLSTGVLLSCDTVNNCLSTVPATVPSSDAYSLTLAKFAELAQTIGSIASAASSAGGSATFSTIAAKVFVRAL